MNRLVISGTGQVYKNLALEEALLRELEEGQCGLYLWVNDPSVILGNNQCAYLECNPGICRSRGIAVARRRSGGGAVYHDRGTLNFTFFYWPGRAGEEEFRELARSAIEELAGRPVISSGNDFLIEGKKISGMAGYEEDGRRLLHGTVLVDADMEAMSQALTVSAGKLRSNGVDSVRKRVVNLNEFVPGISVNQVLEKLAERFSGALGPVETIEFGEADMTGDSSAYAAADWIYGESPDCEMEMEAASGAGIYQLVFRVEGERISEARLYSDAEAREDHSNFERELAGAVYEETQLKERLERYVNTLAAEGSEPGNPQGGRSA